MGGGVLRVKMSTHEWAEDLENDLRTELEQKHMVSTCFMNF